MPECDHCPQCDSVQPYVIENGEPHCSGCMMTKGAAAMAAQHRQRAADGAIRAGRVRVVKRGAIAVAVVVGVTFLVVMWDVPSSRHGGGAIGPAVVGRTIATVLVYSVVFGGLALVGRLLFGKRRSR